MIPRGLPCSGRQGASLSSETALTGESEPVEKTAELAVTLAAARANALSSLALGITNLLFT